MIYVRLCIIHILDIYLSSWQTLAILVNRYLYFIYYTTKLKFLQIVIETLEIFLSFNSK